MSANETPTEDRGPRKVKRRRKFTLAFKRKIVAEAAKSNMHAVQVRYGLFSGAREWPKLFETPKAKALAKLNGAPKALGLEREAIIFLRQAEKAFAAGKDRRGKLLAGLALSTLLGE